MKCRQNQRFTEVLNNINIKINSLDQLINSGIMRENNFLINK